MTASSHARIVAEPGRVRVTFVIDDARLDPEAVGEHVDWRAATEADLRVGFEQGDEDCLQEVFRRSAPLIYTIAYRALGSSTDGGGDHARGICQRLAWSRQLSSRRRAACPVG